MFCASWMFVFTRSCNYEACIERQRLSRDLRLLWLRSGLKVIIHCDKIQYRSFGLLFENVGVLLTYRNAKNYLYYFFQNVVLRIDLYN